MWVEILRLKRIPIFASSKPNDMNEFDVKAREWDNNPGHRERSEAIARILLETAPLRPGMKALEYGAGTGILSFLLAGIFSEITLMDSSPGMVRVMNEKRKDSGLKHFKPVLFDLEVSDFPEHTFNCIYTQMVMHHVMDTGKMISKFYDLISPGGWLAIADLYREDGSFHGDGFTGHKGYDLSELQSLLEEHGFTKVITRDCYVVKKMINNQLKDFPLFLLVAIK
jgi:tRNA (cmo5U34)-methyltransferase